MPRRPPPRRPKKTEDKKPEEKPVDEAPEVDLTVAYFDTETTGLEEPSCCELGVIKCGYSKDGKRVTCVKHNLRIKPTKPIEFEAMAVNHITNEAVADQPMAKDLKEEVHGYFAGADIVCAHNANYDLGVMNTDFTGLLPPNANDPRVLDTLKLAQRRWEELPQYKLQVLRYRFALDKREEVKGDAHASLFDTHYCMLLVEMLMEEGKMGSLEEMLKSTHELRKLKIFSFGKKHHGKKIEDVRRDDPRYVQWVINNTDIRETQPDLYFTLTGREP